MDNGEVVAGLDAEWTLGGAKLFEWAAGGAAFMVSSELLFGGPSGKAMPVLIGIALTVTMGLAILRRRFPDEERGIRNAAMTSLGLAPPGIPPPSSLQPYWSGCPVRDLKKEWAVVKLGLWEVIKEQVEKDQTEEKV